MAALLNQTASFIAIAVALLAFIAFAVVAIVDASEMDTNKKRMNYLTANVFPSMAVFTGLCIVGVFTNQ